MAWFSGGASGGSVRMHLVALLLLSSCAQSSGRVPIVENPDFSIILRQASAAGEGEFAQPLEIATDRLVNMLGSLEIETEPRFALLRKGAKRERQKPLSPSLLHPLAEGLSKALATADAHQEVVVTIRIENRALQVFSRPYLTSFVLYASDEELFILWSRVHWAVPMRLENKRMEPETGKRVMGSFRAVATEGVRVAGEQTHAIDLSAPVFEATGDRQQSAAGQRTSAD